MASCSTLAGAATHTRLQREKTPPSAKKTKKNLAVWFTKFVLLERTALSRQGPLNVGGLVCVRGTRVSLCFVVFD